MDSVRIFINDSSILKGARGGFAVGGRSPGKGLINEYLHVTPDSTRVYVAASTKGAKGGFAVGGRSTLKGTANDYFSVTDGGLSASSYAHLTPQNYFIGQNSGQNNTIGLFNSFIGYMSGQANTEGSSNVFMGFNAGYNNVSGYKNTFLGYKSGYFNNSGYSNVFIGDSAGANNLNGDSTFLSALRWGPAIQQGRIIRFMDIKAAF